MALDVRVELSRMSGALVWAALLHSTLLSHSVGSRSPQTKRRETVAASAVAEESELYKKLGTLKIKAILTKSFKGPMET